MSESKLFFSKWRKLTFYLVDGRVQEFESKEFKVHFDINNYCFEHRSLKIMWIVRDLAIVSVLYEK